MTAKKKPEDKLKAGAPTKYKPEFCAIYIEHGKIGGLVEGFPAILHEKTQVIINKDTIYEWAKNFPEFSDAKKLGDSYACEWWQKQGREAVEEGRKGFPGGVWVFTAKNKFGWRDSIDVHTDPLDDDEKKRQLDKVKNDPKLAKKAAELARLMMNEK